MDTRVAVVSNHDAYALECFEKAPNSRVSWWLMASYGYYLYNRSILSDELFDATGKWLKSIGKMLSTFTNISLHKICLMLAVPTIFVTTTIHYVVKLLLKN